MSLSSNPTSLPISPLQATIAARAQTGPTLAPAPTPQITQTGGETTRELFASLSQGVRNYRNGLAEMAHYAYRLWEKDDWLALNFADEAACYLSLGLSEADWKRHLILGERLSSLSLEEARTLPLASARLLSKISNKIWDEYAWVDEARYLPPRDFALLVADRGGAIRKQQGFAEPKTSLSLQVPTTLHSEFEQRIQSLRQREKLTSAAEVLDFALRSAEKDPALAGDIYRLDQAFQELLRFLDSPDAEQHADSVHKLELKIQKTLGGLKRSVTATSGIQAKVARDPAPGSPAGSPA